MFNFADRVALITGASRGIGLQIARDFAAAGARTVLAARNLDLLRQGTEILQAEGKSAVGIQLDVTDQASIRSLVEEVIENEGRIDILVNNAGVTRDGLLMRMKDEDWDEVMATNLKGVFRLIRQVLPHMLRKRYGRIINISSVVAQTGNPGQANYVASKAGLIGLTKTLAREIASRSVTVNAVAPGFIATDMTDVLHERVRDQLVKTVPLRRAGTVDDVSPGVLFLASEEAGYITGHVLNINGGMYM